MSLSLSGEYEITNKGDPNKTIFSVKLTDPLLKTLCSESAGSENISMCFGVPGKTANTLKVGEKSFGFRELNNDTTVDTVSVDPTARAMTCIGYIQGKIHVTNNLSVVKAANPFPKSVGAQGRSASGRRGVPTSNGMVRSTRLTLPQPTKMEEVIPDEELMVKYRQITIRFLSIKPMTKRDMEVKIGAKTAIEKASLHALLKEVSCEAVVGKITLKNEIFKEVEFQSSLYSALNRADVAKRARKAFSELGIPKDEAEKMIDPAYVPAPEPVAIQSDANDNENETDNNNSNNNNNNNNNNKNNNNNNSNNKRNNNEHENEHNNDSRNYNKNSNSNSDAESFSDNNNDPRNSKRKANITSNAPTTKRIPPIPASIGTGRGKPRNSILEKPPQRPNGRSSTGGSSGHPISSNSSSNAYNNNYRRKKFSRIVSREQYDGYCREFGERYARYRQLNEKIKSNREEFAKLGDKISKTEKDTEEYKTLCKQVVEKYRQRCQDLTRWENEYYELKHTLDEIKGHVSVYYQEQSR